MAIEPVRGILAGLVALLVLAFAQPASAQSLHLPVRIDAPTEPGTTPITVRAPSGFESLARDVASDAPGVLESIYSDLPDQPRPERVEIRLVTRSADIPGAAPPGHGAPRWAAGVAYGDEGVVVVATRREHQSIDVPSTVAHELAHMALDAALGDNAPRWLHEGFAYIHSASGWSYARTRTLTGMAWTGDVIPLSELDRRFPAREQAAGRAYAQSYDFVVYLTQRGRSQTSDDDGDRWPFRAFLAELADGAPIDEAARRAFRADMGQLYGEWYENLRERYLLLPVGLVSMGIWVFAAILLILGYIRKRRQNRRRLALWEEEEAERAADAASAASIDPHG